MTAILFLVLRILLSISLYGFILVLFYYLWKENNQQGNWLSNRKIPTITLTVKSKDSPNRIQYFESEDVLIGRDSLCDVQLSDENVSNHHARLRFHHSQWWLEDLGSKNGTFINDQALITPVVVITDDEINCGLHTLRITISGEIHKKSVTKNNLKDNGENNR
jgi:pSer/pThr/pTyr-binding forkhead associated (FHA) protein